MSPSLLLLLLLAAPLQAEDPASSWGTLAARGEWAVLEARAQERLEAAPQDAEAHYWMARALLRRLDGLGPYSLAVHLRQRTERLAAQSLVAAAAGGSPVRTEALEWLGLAAWAYDIQTFEVEQRLEAAWEHERSAGAAYARGLLAAKAEALEEACAWLERAAEIDPGRGDVWLALADLHSFLGAPQAAQQAWRSAAAGRFPAFVDAEVLLDVLERILPGASGAEARLACFDVLGERPEWQEDALLAWHRAYALEQLGRGPEVLAAFDAGTRGRTPLIDRVHARAASLNDRPEQAVALLRPHLDQRDWDAYTELVSVADRLALQRRFREALAIYEEALAIEGRDERPLHNRAITLWRAGDPRAAAAFAELCALFTRRSDLLNDAGLAALARGEALRAEALFREACELPDSSDARENLAALILSAVGGRERLGAERRREAAALLDEVLAEEPERARSLILRLHLRLDASL